MARIPNAARERGRQGRSRILKLSVAAKGAKVPDLLDDLVLVFDIKAKKA